MPALKLYRCHAAVSWVNHTPIDIKMYFPAWSYFLNAQNKKSKSICDSWLAERLNHARFKVESTI